ncbi:hypothetical protein PC116_g5593 [Phytophthora cactorum]|uniref:Uncharacterized protein n=1 Tax=Phytophthora cactorum TaxID=29920 RepID=A0A8T1DRM0_9STRA|nr:hypothetical protein Pcac1_g9674 [Phytophthora cactorum]KAG2911056.1 hypothetical protein PC114_g9541 [Phytophthora cactorum]KAG2943598.1 hypothetical protein PC117_g9425 [Phytophthora cactorum]KAG3017071.1 hypothetical protein PC119_g11151 [Phytophthora cactorum]KAG3028059.1 hypothetical protein PC120_g5068 [Phytophthora cactorum]
MLDGGIASEPDSDPFSSHSTSWCSKECDGVASHDNNAQPSQSICSPQSPRQPTCLSPTTASFVGLRCWASTFAGEAQNFFLPGEKDKRTP